MCPYIKVFEREVSCYVLFAGIGMFVSAMVLFELLVEKLLLKKYIKLIASAFLGLFLGGKLFGIISYTLYLWNQFQYISISESIKYSGIVFYGGLLGYIVTLQLLCKWCKHNFQDISAEIAVCMPLFHSFARIGCFFTGCCYGKHYTGMLVVNYRIGFDGVWQQRFPVQIAEAAVEFLLFIILLKLYHSNKVYIKRCLLHIYLSFYAVARFVLEFYRGDEVRGFVKGLSFSQCISLAIVCYMTIWCIKRRRRKEWIKI